jgi:hypothetical protein
MYTLLPFAVSHKNIISAAGFVVTFSVQVTAPHLTAPQSYAIEISDKFQIISVTLERLKTVAYT